MYFRLLRSLEGMRISYAGAINWRRYRQWSHFPNTRMSKFTCPFTNSTGQSQQDGGWKRHSNRIIAIYKGIQAGTRTCTHAVVCNAVPLSGTIKYIKMDPKRVDPVLELYSTLRAGACVCYSSTFARILLSLLVLLSSSHLPGWDCCSSVR